MTSGNGASPRIHRKASDITYTLVDIDALVPAQSLPAAADHLANASNETPCSQRFGQVRQWRRLIGGVAATTLSDSQAPQPVSLA